MIPIRDHNRSKNKPIAAYLLIAINIAVFWYMMTLPDNSVDSFINNYALIPAQITAGHHLITLITSMFIHGSIGHIAGNMLFLYIFSDNLEDKLGHGKFLAFYFICGLAADFAQIAIDPMSTVPQIGASGAIAGVMGGYLVLFPTNQIDVLFEIGPFLKDGVVPAWTMLIYWFAAQLLFGVGSLTTSQDIGGVAYFAHIGGFTSGCIMASIFKRKTSDENHAVYL